jgi:hypothetical protein
MRTMLRTAAATLAIAVVMAVTAAPAGAQDLIEYALMAGFVSVAGSNSASPNADGRADMPPDVIQVRFGGTHWE